MTRYAVSRPEGHRSTDEPAQIEAIDAYRDRHGTPPTWTVWVDWHRVGLPRDTFPTPLLTDHLSALGITPVIFWQPVGPGNATIPWADIAAGAWDGLVDAFAEAAGAVSGPVIVRLAQEFNAPWFPWAVADTSEARQDFKAAWRRIAGRMPSNVGMFWCPMAGHSIQYLYPGDDAVAYVGADAYSWDGVGTLASILGPMLVALRALTDRRIIIGETGVKAGGDPKARRDWLRSARDLEGVHTLIYFDYAPPGEVWDWSLDSAPSLRYVWNQLV